MGNEAEQINGDREQPDSEHVLHAFHPRPRLGQQDTGTQPDSDQDHTHAERHGEHDGATEQRVLTHDGHAQHRYQQRRHTSTDDQGRGQTKQEHAHQGTSAQALRTRVQPRLDKARHLQRIEAKHGQRHGDEYGGQNAECPWILEIRLQLVPGCAGDGTDGRIGHSGAEDIGRR